MPDSTEAGADRRHSSNTAGLADGVLSSVGECVYEWNIASDELRWNNGAANLLCVKDKAQIASGRAFNALLLADTVKSRNDIVLSSQEVDSGDGVAYRLQYALSSETLRTGSDIWVEDTGKWYAGDDGTPERAVGVLRIINERRQLEERLDRMSRYDPLTGLFNRAHLNLCLEETFEQLKKTGESAAFILVGLEHFELINSVYGYDCGDTVITEIARRLNDNLRDIDIVGRFSGAKIGIILPDCDEKAMLVAGHRILNMLRENVIHTPQGGIAVTISIGGVILPQNARDTRRALMAAYQALAESRGARDASIVSYRHDPRKDAARLKAARMAERIVTALKEGRVHLAWQPVVDSSTGNIAFHEALLRLEQPDGSVLEAGDFVSTAESLGLIRMVDHHALDRALETLIMCPRAVISLNVSFDTACDPEWLSKLGYRAQRNPEITSRLIVEITESHAAESMEEARRFIDRVKGLGFRVALDDFGAGFTSFRNLKSLPFDIIKVDGQFVEDLETSVENQSFIRALVDLARLFHAQTVVEWVEDTKTAELLHDWGVDYLQGFKYGEPQRDLPWAVVGKASSDSERQAS